MPSDLISKSKAEVEASREARGFTPGPWTAHQGWADPWITHDPEEHPDWCEVTGPDGGPHLSIHGHFGIANAHLIAAAPELYEATVKLVDFVEGMAEGFGDDPTFALARDWALAAASAGRAALSRATPSPDMNEEGGGK